MLQRAPRHAGRVIVHAKDTARHRINVSPGQAIEHRRILGGLVEALVHIRQVDCVDLFHADEDPLAV